MTVSTHIFTWVVIVAFVVALAAGGVTGLRQARHANEPEVRQLEIVDPQFFAGPPAGTLLSPGGFSGFGAAALRGRVLASGQLSSVSGEGDGGSIVVRSGSRDLRVDYLSTLRLYRLTELPALADGDTVVVRVVQGAVSGILRVPPEVSADREPGATAP